jgi:hypothetical protein
VSCSVRCSWACRVSGGSSQTLGVRSATRSPRGRPLAPDGWLHPTGVEGDGYRPDENDVDDAESKISPAFREQYAAKVGRRTTPEPPKTPMPSDPDDPPPF